MKTLQHFIITFCLLLMPIITLAQDNKQTRQTSQTKKVTYYADRFHGKKTASGKIFNMHEFTCAAISKYKFGTILKVTNPENGKSVIVEVTDRGALASRGVTLDLSKAAFEEIADIKRGHIKVIIEVLETELPKI